MKGKRKKVQHFFVYIDNAGYVWLFNHGWFAAIVNDA